MTDSTNEKNTTRQGRLGLQDENFDFELSDVNITPESVDSPFAETQQANDTPNYIASAAPLIPSGPVASEIKTNFYVDYFEQRKRSKTTKPVSDTETNQPAIDDTMILEIPAEPAYAEEPLDEQPPFIDGSGMAVAVLSQFKSKQERINRQQEELIYEFSEKMKSTRTVTNTAVFFGIVALAAAAVLGFMLSKTNTEISNLASTTTAIKDDIRNAAKSSFPNDLEGTDPALDQLNQKVDDVIAQLNEVTTRQNKASTAEKTAANKPIVTKPLDVAVVETKPVVASMTNPAPVVKTVKAPIVEKNTAVVNAPTPKPEINSKTANKTVKAINTKQAVAVVNVPTTKPETNSKTTNKAVKNSSTEKSTTVVNAPTTKPETNSKTANKASVIPDRVVPANDINNAINNAHLPAAAAATTTTAAVTSANTNSNANTATPASAGWTVNLASSNKMEDAKKTAAKFTQQGVPVTISPYKVKNETRYRLQVKGFKSKDEAAAYGNKAKDTLKLNSVWINP